MPWMTPGASLHRELELFVDAGISPADTLRIATQNGSKFVYREDQIGTIETGKIADLVVLSANPLDDIRNTRKIVSVVKAGISYMPDDLLNSLDHEKTTSPTGQH
jgi:imidazolonepropionase-like amidohydrolase